MCHCSRDTDVGLPVLEFGSKPSGPKADEQLACGAGESVAPSVVCGAGSVSWKARTLLGADSIAGTWGQSAPGALVRPVHGEAGGPCQPAVHTEPCTHQEGSADGVRPGAEQGVRSPSDTHVSINASAFSTQTDQKRGAAGGFFVL